MRKADVEKIIALKKAGWNTKRIADEMHMDQDDVEKVMSDCMEKEEKVMSHQEKDGNGEKKIKKYKKN